MRRLWNNTFGRAAERILPAAAVGIGLAIASVPHAAHAQFFDGWGGGWGGWGAPMGPGQIYNSIADRGFRVIGPLRRNGSVFVADVVDRRGRRERLIVAAADGEILQRFLLQDPGFSTAPRNDLAQPRQEFGQPVERADRGDLVPPASIPNAGDGSAGETAVEPMRPRAVPRPVKPPRPRVVDRTPEGTPASRRDAVVPNHNTPRLKLKSPPDNAAAPNSSEPPTTTASRPADTPEKPSVPTPAAPTTTTRLSDPLAIPGGEPKPAKPAAEAPKTSAAVTGTQSNPRIIPGTVTGAPPPAVPPATPAPQTPAKSSDVPVAPLD